MLSTAAFAQFESGKVYRFINKADTNIAMTAASTTDVYGSKKMDNGYAQLWLAEQHPNNAGAWSLRSVGNGLYLTPPRHKHRLDIQRTALVINSALQH